MANFPLPSNEGLLKSVAGANPAAGQEVNDTVPVGKWWMVLSVSVQLVQGLTQTPQPTLVFDDGANVIAQYPGCSAAQAVSTTCQYSWAADCQLSGQVGATPNIVACGPIGEAFILPGGYRIRTVTAGIGANTDYGVPRYYVCELG
jgi:hypothetical protein